MHKHVHELYPLHVEALIQARLVKNQAKFPFLSTYIKNKTVSDQDTDEIDSEVDQIPIQYDNRTTYFTIGYCDTWEHSFILRLMKKLKKKYQLSWIRDRIAY